MIDRLIFTQPTVGGGVKYCYQNVVVTVCTLCTCICLSVCLFVCVYRSTCGATGPNYTACKSPTWRPPPPSSRQHLGNDDFLQVRSLNIIDANILHFFTPSRFGLLNVCFGLGAYTAAFTYSIARRTYAYGLLLLFFYLKNLLVISV